MHQRLYRPRDITVVDEKVFFDIECCVATFEIACMIVFDAVPEHQVLGSRRSTNRICLHEAHGLESAIQRRWFWKVSRDSKSPQFVECTGTGFQGFHDLQQCEYTGLRSTILDRGTSHKTDD